MPDANLFGSFELEFISTFAISVVESCRWPSPSTGGSIVWLAENCDWRECHHAIVNLPNFDYIHRENALSARSIVEDNFERTIHISTARTGTNI